MFSNQHQLISCLNNSLRIGRSHNYRVMLVLAGEANQYLQHTIEAFDAFKKGNDIKNSTADRFTTPQMSKSVTPCSEHIMHVPDMDSNSDVSDEINSLLGSEHMCVIFDARSKFDERLFAAAAGTVTASGLLVLQTPTLNTWATQQHHLSAMASQSPFVQRFCRKLLFHQALSVDARSNRNGQFTIMNGVPAEAAFLIAASEPKTDRAHENFTGSSQCNGWKIEQNSMLESLVTHLQKKPESVSVVQGDRGRGKSSLVGRAIKQLMANDPSKHRSITITANRRSSCDILLKHSDTQIPFIPIDQALLSTHDVLIVEEAGSIPIPVLEQLLQQSQSTIFATTVQGYEGAGRGFAIRFAKQLNKLKPGWLKLQPTLPIRWSAGDPLEAFVNDALLLKTELQSIKKSTRLNPDDSQVTLIDRHTLANDDSLLVQVYGLLVQAHYQTTPADLRNLLDQPSLLLFVQKTDLLLTGAALVALEGEIPNHLHQSIMHKKRRIADQILPQLLAQSSGETDTLKERFARIVRIAIHPDIHQQGFGTHLFEQLHKQLMLDTSQFARVNSIGTSFGADEHTLSFWLKQGLKPIHYGYKANPRSALRAACLISSHRSPIKETIDKACCILSVNTRAQLSEDTNGDPVQKKILSATTSTNTIVLPLHVTQCLINDFYHARRSFIDTVGLLLTSDFCSDTDAVHKLVRETLNGYRHLSPKTRRMAEERLRSVLLKKGAVTKLD